MNLILKSTILLGVAVVTTFGSQAQTIKVNVPFAFEANGKTLPAGDYSVSKQSGTNGVIYAMRNRDTKEGVLLMANHTITYRADGTAKLVFQQGVDGYFLTEVWDGDGARAMSSPRGRNAIVALNKSATRIAIPASK